MMHFPGKLGRMHGQPTKTASADGQGQQAKKRKPNSTTTTTSYALSFRTHTMLGSDQEVEHTHRRNSMADMSVGLQAWLWLPAVIPMKAGEIKGTKQIMAAVVSNLPELQAAYFMSCGLYLYLYPPCLSILHHSSIFEGKTKKIRGQTF